MKKQFYLFVVIVLASSILFAVPAKAQTAYKSAGTGSESFWDTLLGLFGLGGTSSGKTGSTTGTSGTTSGQSGAALPINNGIVFLMLGGFAIGISAVAKAKKLKPATIKA